MLDIGEIDFTPDWAKKDAGVSVGRGVRPEHESAERRPRGDRPMQRPGSGGFTKKPFEKRGDAGPRFHAEPVRPLAADIKVLPETKALGTIIRKLQSDTHAYKLKDLAYFFLDNPESVLLRIAPKDDVHFFQCKACGFASTNRDEVEDHIVNAHIGDYYDSKEIETEPPKGNFSCVAKCGLSGVLLGPPNIHEFNAVVKEMIRTRYPEMTESQYRSHIEMVRDTETIETWRKSAVKRTVFIAKGQADVEGVPSLTRQEAEGALRRNIMPSLLDTPKILMITADQALKSPVRPLVWAARDALSLERRAPYGMCFALRGAFHHRKLKFFRANDARGPEFVTNVDYKEFDAEHAIPELATMARFIEAHPCCDVNELPKEDDALKHLQWLVSTGHVVAFTNGVYSKVEKFPKYGPQWKKRKAEGETKKAEPKKEENGNEATAILAE